MPEIKFNAATIETVQQLVYPLIRTFFDWDPQEWVGERHQLFIRIGEAFNAVAELFLACGIALEDGLLTEEEIGRIINEALDIPGAIERIKMAFDAPDEEPPE